MGVYFGCFIALVPCYAFDISKTASTSYVRYCGR